jgi:hypothetical protein
VHNYLVDTFRVTVTCLDDVTGERHRGVTCVTPLSQNWGYRVLYGVMKKDEESLKTG